MHVAIQRFDPDDRMGQRLAEYVRRCVALYGTAVAQEHGLRFDTSVLKDL
jgi:hypothetical protein